ncbi:MAG: ATP-binding cassette domain-containing protein [Gammaproteobacteria bacterium]|nr:ATP-binding cassette domain-containing protein [Gammaproteobacteria bacterium]
MPLIHLQDACLEFNHVPILLNANLSIDRGERLCLIGRNGTGKSTLLNVIAKRQALESGKIWQTDGIKVSRLAQEVPDAEAATLFEIVAAGLGDHSDMLARYHSLSMRLADGNQADLDELSRLQAQIEDAGAWSGSERVDATLSRLSLPPDAIMSECSGGIRRRAMLGQALVCEPDLLLLDEPTNHMDIEAIRALEDALLNFAGSVLFITHDRAFIDNLATRIIELDRGHLRSFPGSYKEFQARKNSLLEAEAESNRLFDKNLAQEEVWIRQGIKARRTRNEGRVRRLEALRRERAERIEREGVAKMTMSTGQRSGKLVVECEDVSFAFGKLNVIRDFSTTILRGDRIGLIGRNGTGKSTLLRLLINELKPTAGTVRHGTKLRIAYFDQERVQLDSEKSVRDNIADGADKIQIGEKSRHVISYLGDFLFSPARANSPVSTLSGGERNRLLLAKLFARSANLLVLDEPTNDLDVETLELLEELLTDFDGTLLLVSHDRRFLDQTVTSTLALNGDGTVEENVGGYSDWLKIQSAKAEATAALTKTEKKPDNKTKKLSEVAKKKNKSHKPTYKERLELEALPGTIADLEKELAAMHKAIADPHFYRQAPDVVAAELEKLSDLEASLEAAYARWAELET